MRTCIHRAQMGTWEWSGVLVKGPVASMFGLLVFKSLRDEQK